MSRARQQRFRNSARRVVQATGEPIVICRQSEGEYKGGEWEPAAVKEEHRTATVLPLRAGSMKGGDLREVLPDGARLDQGRLFLIPFLPGQQLAAIRTVFDKSGPDIIRFQKVDYRVYNVEDFANLGHIEVVGLGPDRDRAD